MLLLAAAAYAILLGGSRERAAIERVLASPIATLAMLAAIVIATWRIYPLADALRLQGRGSTADDAGAAARAVAAGCEKR